jgi:hypothetical protein
MQWLTLILRRLLVLVLGLATAWLIVRFYVDADHRLPWFLAIAASYGVAAYLILPRAIRTGLWLLKRGRVPSYTITGDGMPGDPVNLALVGSLPQLKDAFRKAGWFEADPLSLASSWKMARTFVLNQPYPTAPFSTLYLFGRGQDIGFQKPIGDSPRKRHHVRFWGIPLGHVQADLESPGFWLNSPRPNETEPVIWIGAGTKDTGLSLTKMTFQITHATDVDTNAERDFILDDLSGCGMIQDRRSYLPGERLEIGKVNRYVTDGEVGVANLTGQA